MNFFNRLRVLFVLLIILIGPVSHSQNETFTMTQIGANNLLKVPWDLQYGPDGYLWVTEKRVGVVRVNPATAQRDELIQLSDLSSTATGQDGLLGMALHPDFLTTSPYVYLSYTHLVSGQNKQKIVRYTYTINGNDGSLYSPVVLIDNLPSSNDHQSGRLIFGPDQKLYYTIGDQAVKVCASNLAQFLPTQLQIDQKNWANYPGKTLRLNLDGLIPTDNPVLNGVKSHIYSYGHRNAQGLVFGSNGILYSDEQGPSSDDEINIINSGKNYGWPFVAGVKDNLMYDADGCLTTETSFTATNYQDPIMSLFLANTYKDPACTDSWMCRPNIAPSSLEIYESDAIPAWKNSLLLTSLKKGRVYRVKLDATGTAVVGNAIQYFYTQNRYRDIVAAPDGKSFYLITDDSGKTADASGMNTVSVMQNPAAILKFTLNESLSVASLEKEPAFKFWPNPAKHTLFIEIKEPNGGNFKAELINSSGQVVKKIKELQLGINETNIANLPVGVYILKLYSNDTTWQESIIHI